MKKLRIIFILPLLVSAAQCSAFAGGLYQVSDSPYATFIARKPGDLLTVIVEEHAITSDNGERKHNRNNSFAMNIKEFFFPGLNAGKGFLDTKGGGDHPILEWDSDSKFKAKAENSADHEFLTTFQVQIVEEVTEGQFVIRGHRKVNLNGKSRTIYVSGVIRQRDITRRNTISSYQIADALVEIDGEVGGKDVAPGLLNRIANFIF